MYSSSLITESSLSCVLDIEYFYMKEVIIMYSSSPEIAQENVWGGVLTGTIHKNAKLTFFLFFTYRRQMKRYIIYTYS